MALGTSSKLSLRDPSFSLRLLNSPNGHVVRHFLDGHVPFLPVRQRRPTEAAKPVNVVGSASSPDGHKEEEQVVHKGRVKWSLTNPKPAFWKEMPEPREFSEGHSFLVPEGQKRSRQADLRRKRAMYAQMTGGGAKKVTTDPNLVRMLNYRLTSGEHKGKMLREVSKKYLEWLASSAAPLKQLQKGELSKVVLRSSKEVNDPSEMAAIVLQLPEIKDTVRQVDIEEMQEALLTEKGKGKAREKGGPDAVYKAALFKLKSLNIQVELEKQAVEDRRNAARLAVEAGAIEDPSEARRVRRRVKQWEEAEVQKKVGLAKTIEERRLQKLEAEGEEAMKSSYGVAASGPQGTAALAPGQLPVFKGREEMLSVAKRAMMKAKLRPSQLKDADMDLDRSFEDNMLGQQKPAKRGRPPKKGTGEGGSKVDWRSVSKRNPSSS